MYAGRPALLGGTLVTTIEIVAERHFFQYILPVRAPFS
jgi:hypothetical protein